MPSGVRVDITTDSSGARAGVAETKAALKELNDAGQTVGAGGMTSLNTSAVTVGKTFTRTGKTIKAAGKVFKNSGLDALSAGSALASVIPQASGLTSGLGAVTTGADALITTASSLGTVALPAMGAAAIAAAAAYAFLHEDVSAATEAFRHLDAEQAKVKTAHREVAVSALQQREATRGLTSAALSLEGAQIDLIRANRDLATAEKDHGRNSIEVRTATLEQAKAEQQLKETRRQIVDQSQAALATSKRRSQATQDEAKAVRDAKAEAEKYGIALRTGFINGKDAVEMKKRIAAAADLEAKASFRSESRHRSNSKELRAQADLLRGETNPALVNLRKQLIAASNTELDMANAIKAMRDLATAAGTAAGGVQHVYDLLRNPPSVPDLGAFPGGGPGGGGGGGRGRGGGGGGNPGIPKGKQAATEFTGASKTETATRPIGPRDYFRGLHQKDRLTLIPGGTPLSPTDRAGLIIEGRHRGDSLQEKVINRNVAANAKAAGITNPDEIALRQERAVLKARKEEIRRDMATVRRAVRQTKALIARRKHKRAAAYKALKAVKGNSDAAKKRRDDLNQQIDGHNQAIQSRYDELNALIRQGADLQAEAKEIGFDIQGLDAEIAATPDVEPSDDAGIGDTGDTGGTADAGTADAGVSPDAQAQIDQANQRATNANRASDANAALVRTLFGSGSIDPGTGSVTVNFNSLIPGDPETKRQVAAWVVGALAGQGSVPTSSFRSAA